MHFANLTTAIDNHFIFQHKIIVIIRSVYNQMLKKITGFRLVTWSTRNVKLIINHCINLFAIFMALASETNFNVKKKPATLLLFILWHVFYISELQLYNFWWITSCLYYSHNCLFMRLGFIMIRIVKK